MPEQKWFLYILQCSDSTLYTGITTDIDRRVQQHESGKGARYTKGRGPFKVIYTENHNNRSEASKREAQIKAMDRVEKLRLNSVVPTPPSGRGLG
jgi:putative endonuclease